MAEAQVSGFPVRPDPSVPLVLHVDMDAFFAGVEIRSDPRLRGKPLVVAGGPGDRGVVTAASYPSRSFGIRSGMALSEARRRCPGLLVLPVDPAKMIHESLEVLTILDRFSPRVEPASIDEATLEFPPAGRWSWPNRARSLAGRIQTAVLMERGLSCSVGCGPNKLQAKMASSHNKPRGVTVVPPGAFLKMFGLGKVSLIPGIGRVTEASLARLGIVTVGDLARTDPAVLGRVFGSGGDWLSRSSHGQAEVPVTPAGEEPNPKSAGHETTFARDTADREFLRATLWLLADRVARRLRRGGFTARTVEVRFKLEGRRASRRRTLPSVTDQADDLARIAWDLLEPARAGRALRLLGVAASGLGQGLREGSLLPSDRRRERVSEIGDHLRDRFGEGILLPARVYRRGRHPGERKPGPGFRRPGSVE